MNSLNFSKQNQFKKGILLASLALIAVSAGAVFYFSSGKKSVAQKPLAKESPVRVMPALPESLNSQPSSQITEITIEDVPAPAPQAEPKRTKAKRASRFSASKGKIASAGLNLPPLPPAGSDRSSTVEMWSGTNKRNVVVPASLKPVETREYETEF